MTVIFEFFKHISENYGATFAILFLTTALLLFTIFFIVKTFPDVIQRYVETKLIESKKNHSVGSARRKKVSIKINKVLSDLVVDTNADRALLFEFSNGTSNLAGLPFLFISATSESISPGTASVSHLYQRINISLFAKFIVDLERSGYYFTEDICSDKNELPSLYNFLKSTGVKSIMFYSIYGVNDTLGFIVLTSINNKILLRKDIISKVAESAQVISSLLNLEELEDKIK